MTRTPRQPRPKITGTNRPQVAARIISTLSQLDVHGLRELYQEAYGAPTLSSDRRQLTSDIARQVGAWARGEAELGSASQAWRP